MKEGWAGARFTLLGNFKFHFHLLILEMEKKVLCMDLIYIKLCLIYDLCFYVVMFQCEWLTSNVLFSGNFSEA